MGAFSWLAGRKRSFPAQLALPPALARLARQAAQPRPRERSRTHGFLAGYSDGLAAGKRDRMTDDWQPASLSPTSIHRMDGNLLLRRARDLVENNPFAKSGVEAYIANVVGCGITPKPQPRGSSEAGESPERRRQWVEAWNWWGGEYEPQADITGMQHYYELTALWLTEIIVAGGCLKRYVALDPDEHRHRPIKLAIELIPEERFADDKDDYLVFLKKKKSGNPIQRGVEFDAATGRNLYYWIRPAHPSDAGAAWEPIRLDARACRYSFFKTRIGQRRGFSMLKAVVMWLWKLGYYVDNELMASAIKSCFAAVISNDDEDADFAGLDDDSQGGIFTDLNGNLLEKLEPGIVARLRGKNAKIAGVGPNTPTSEQHAWMMLIETTIAIGMGLSYAELMRDYSQGNFSSMRAGSNSDRQRFRPMQRFVINQGERPDYEQFVRAASQAGLDGFPRQSQLVSEYQQWLRCAWRTPGWASVNPWDDARANVLKIDNGLGTREEVIGAEGGDWEETDEQLEREAKSESDRGLHFGAPGEGADQTQPGEGQADSASGGPTQAAEDSEATAQITARLRRARRRVKRLGRQLRSAQAPVVNVHVPARKSYTEKQSVERDDKGLVQQTTKQVTEEYS